MYGDMTPIDGVDSSVLRRRQSSMRRLIQKAALLDPRTAAWAVKSDWEDRQAVNARNQRITIPGTKAMVLQEMQDLYHKTQNVNPQEGDAGKDDPLL